MGIAILIAVVNSITVILNLLIYKSMERRRSDFVDQIDSMVENVKEARVMLEAGNKIMKEFLLSIKK